VDEVAKTASGGFFYSLVRWPHSQMLRIWLIFIFGSFAVSILTLTYVQTRVWKKQGWSALRERPFSETYWTNLSPVERVLLWLGFVALYITLVSATGWKVITLFSQSVSSPWTHGLTTGLNRFRLSLSVMPQALLPTLKGARK